MVCPHYHIFTCFSNVVISLRVMVQQNTIARHIPFVFLFPFNSVDNCIGFVSLYLIIEGRSALPLSQRAVQQVTIIISFKI